MLLKLNAKVMEMETVNLDDMSDSGDEDNISSEDEESDDGDSSI